MKIVSDETEKFQVSGANKITVKKQGEIIIENFEKSIKSEQINVTFENIDEKCLIKSAKELPFLKKR